jgi:membrane protein YdbS with pleckstrin-like domain
MPTSGSAPAPDDGERRLDPRIRTVWRVTAVAAVALVGAVAALLAIGAAVATDVAVVPVVATSVVLLAAALGVAWWWPGVRYRHWRYRLGPDALELSYGPIFRTESLIPYFRVQHVDTSAGPIERKLGLANLQVHTASAATDATLRGLAVADADAVRRRLLEGAGAGDAV